MKLRDLLKKEDRLKDELEHWNFQVNVADNDEDEDVINSLRKVERELKDTKKKIIKEMEKELKKRKSKK